MPLLHCKKNKPITYDIDDNGCFVCTSHKGRPHNKYPLYMVNGRSMHLHRCIYEQKWGSVSEDKVVMHTCDNPRCINISHLTMGTQLDNIQDRVDKRRSSIGETHGKSKLTEKEVKEIRDINDLSLRKLGKRYSVSHNCIDQIKKNKTWRHI